MRSGKLVVTIPDWLTIARAFPLSPLILLLAWKGEWKWALVVFALAGVTDLCDGMLARKLGTPSGLHEQSDDVADLVYAACSLLGAHLAGWLSWTVIVLIVAAFIPAAVITGLTSLKKSCPRLYWTANGITALVYVGVMFATAYFYISKAYGLGFLWCVVAAVPIIALMRWRHCLLWFGIALKAKTAE